MLILVKPSRSFQSNVTLLDAMWGRSGANFSLKGIRSYTSVVMVGSKRISIRSTKRITIRLKGCKQRSSGCKPMKGARCAALLPRVTWASTLKIAQKLTMRSTIPNSGNGFLRNAGTMLTTS